MTTLWTILSVAENNRRIMENDPHGFSLAITSVCFVFCVLLLLYVVYGISGNYFKRRARRLEAAEAAKAASDAHVSDAKAVAIARALRAYMRETGTETESGIVTITHRSDGAWRTSSASKQLYKEGRR